MDVVRRDFALRCRPVTSSPTGRALCGFVPPASEGNAFAIQVPLRPPGAPTAQNLIRDISMANEFDQTFRASPLTQARAPSALALGPCRRLRSQGCRAACDADPIPFHQRFSPGAASGPATGLRPFMPAMTAWRTTSCAVLMWPSIV